MIDRRSAPREERAPSILDHLSDGMSVVLVAPWLILVPLALDLYLLLGPGFSSRPMTSSIGRWFARQDVSHSADLSTWFANRGTWDESRLMALLLPNVATGIGNSNLYHPIDRSMHAFNALGSFGMAALFVVGTVLIFVGYMIAMASAADYIRAPRPSVMALYMDRTLKFATFLLLALAVLTVVMAVIALPIELFSNKGVTGDTLLAIIGLVGFPLLILTLFVPEAIVIDGLWPVAAIRASAGVVFGSFWSSMGFFVVSLMIDPGMLSIWKNITDKGPGLATAIVLNAALATSVAIASLSFYRARSDRAPKPAHVGRG